MTAERSVNYDRMTREVEFVNRLKYVMFRHFMAFLDALYLLVVMVCLWWLEVDYTIAAIIFIFGVLFTITNYLNLEDLQGYVGIRNAWLLWPLQFTN